MWFKLTTADFSSNNLGTISGLSNSWSVSKTLGAGASYSGVSSVSKDGSYKGTVTISDSYELVSIIVTMGGATQSNVVSTSGKTSTITIAEVTGNIVISVTTKAVSSSNGGGSNEEDSMSPSTTTWYTAFATGSSNNGTDIAKASYAGFAYQGANNNYVNKPVNAIRLRVAQAGSMTIGIASSDGKTIKSTQTIVLSNPSASTVQTYTLTTPITLASDELLCFGKQSDTGLFYYKESGTATADNGERMWHHVGTSSATASSSSASLTIDAGYVVS